MQLAFLSVSGRPGAPTLTLGCMVNKSIVRSQSMRSSRSEMGGTGVEIGGTPSLGGWPGEWVMLVAADVCELRVLSMRELKELRLFQLTWTGTEKEQANTYTEWESIELSTPELVLLVSFFSLGQLVSLL